MRRKYDLFCLSHCMRIHNTLFLLIAIPVGIYLFVFFQYFICIFHTLHKKPFSKSYFEMIALCQCLNRNIFLALKIVLHI